MASPEICPNCGAPVPCNARACPECGSCEETGWSEAAQTSNADLPEEDFDYAEFVEREFGCQRSVPRGVPRFWWVIALAILVVMLFVLLRQL